MGMSTHVVGFRPADEKWKKMKAIWDNCEAAEVEIPNEVDEFFGSEAPGDKPGAEVDLGEAVQEWSDPEGGSEGYELDITKLPKNVTVVRFYNNW